MKELNLYVVKWRETDYLVAASTKNTAIAVCLDEFEDDFSRVECRLLELESGYPGARIHLLLSEIPSNFDSENESSYTPLWCSCVLSTEDNGVKVLAFAREILCDLEEPRFFGTFLGVENGK